MPLVGLAGLSAVVPFANPKAPVLPLASTMPVDAVSAKLLDDDCTNGVVTEVVADNAGTLKEVPFHVNVAAAPNTPELLNCTWVFDPAGLAVTVAQDVFVPSVVKNLPELAVWLGARLLNPELAVVALVPPLAIGKATPE
jgi:hypothetical protein